MSEPNAAAPTESECETFAALFRPSWAPKTILDLLPILRAHVASETTQLRAQVEALTKDKERLDAVEEGKLGVWFNSLHAGFVVQKNQQTVGTIGVGRTAREAIDAAKTAK